METELTGWVKAYRKAIRSRYWRHHNARLVWEWLLARAAPWPRESSSGVREERGQLFTTYDEAAAENFLRRDPVRRAFVALKGFGMIRWEERRRGLLVTIVNYQRYQGTSLHGEESGAEAARNDRQPNRHPESATSATHNDDATDYSASGNNADVGGARQAETPATASQTATHILIGSKKLKNINPPNPLLKKGGLSSSDFSDLAALSGAGLSPDDDPGLVLGTASDRTRLVLAMWRAEWEGAGQAFFASKKVIAGAGAVAEAWTRDLVASPWQMRMGIRELVRVILHQPGCRMYGLKNLVASPDRFFPPPPVMLTARRKVRWLLECDVCGWGKWTEWLPADTDPPPAQECASGRVENMAFVPSGCQGRVEAVRMEELTA